jgi:hypothetical protein
MTAEIHEGPHPAGRYCLAMAKTTSDTGSGLRGRFWLQGEKEDKAVPGRLFLQAGANPRLELDEPLTPLTREIRRTKLADGGEAVTSTLIPPEELARQSLTIYGTLETGDLVTLPSAFTAGWTERGTGYRSHRLQAFYALLGDHVDGTDALFTSLRIRIRHLDAWANLPGFKLNPDLAAKKYTLSFEAPDVPPATMASGAQLAIEQETGWGPGLPTACGGQLERRLWLNVQGMPPTAYRDLDRKVVKPLMNLLTFAVGKECPLVEMMISAGPDHPWVTVHHAAMKAPAEEIVPAWNILLPMTEIGLGGVTAWLDSTASLGPLPSVVSRVVSSQDDTLEAQLLELTTVAEGLHRLLLDPQGMTYAKRLEGLAEHAEDAAPGATGKTAEWIRCVKVARNDFAHKLEHGFLDEDHAEEWAALLLSLQWLLTGTLLLKTGISPSALGTRIAAHQPYQMFLLQAQAWLPEVY